MASLYPLFPPCSPAPGPLLCPFHTWGPALSLPVPSGLLRSLRPTVTGCLPLMDVHTLLFPSLVLLFSSKVLYLPPALLDHFMAAVYVSLVLRVDCRSRNRLYVSFAFGSKSVPGT
jgi:hypothetical protein